MLDNNLAEEVLDIALETASKRGATYADIRIVSPKNESVSIKNGIIEDVSVGEESGIGIRVLVDGAWGFSSIPCLTKSKRVLRRYVLKATREALELARVSSWGRTFPIELYPMPEPKHGNFSYKTPCEIDPFLVPLGDKMNLLILIDKALQHGSSKLIVREASLQIVDVQKIFASQEGNNRRVISQQTVYTMLRIAATASDGTNTQRRSLGLGKNPSAGYESLLRLDLNMEGERLAQEAEELLLAPECPDGIMDVIIMPDHLGLHVHETGHAFEGDRLLGYEQTYVGGTFISDIIQQVGNYEFGSPHVNIVADATLQNGFGTYGFDDEGVLAQKIYLVRKGILENVLTSREVAPQLNRILKKEYFRSSSGAMRASSFNRMPLVRMTNISLMPGTDSLEDLIARVKLGIMLTGTYSWSMSEDRRDFDFGLEKGVIIKDGRLTQTVKNPGYTGNNLEFWKNCDGVGCPADWEILNVPNCGKGHPGQTMFTGHGSSPALFRDVMVYNRRGRK